MTAVAEPVAYGAAVPKRKQPRVVGLDLSLTATGVAAGAADTLRFPRLKGIPRLVALRDEILARCADADLVLIEGYSFNSRVGGEHLGELGGVVRVGLFEHGIRYVEIPPAVVKKFATGKGNAPKDAVLTAAVRLGFDGDDNNGADAWWLRQLGLYRIGDPSALKQTQARDEATAKVSWPEDL